MDLNINIKHILLYIYEYLLFLKEEVFSNTWRSITGSNQPTPESANGSKRNQMVEPSDTGAPLVTYQHDYKLRFSRDEPEVCLLLNIYSIYSSCFVEL